MEDDFTFDGVMFCPGCGKTVEYDLENCEIYDKERKESFPGKVAFCSECGTMIAVKPDQKNRRYACTLDNKNISIKLTKAKRRPGKK